MLLFRLFRLFRLIRLFWQARHVVLRAAADSGDIVTLNSAPAVNKNNSGEILWRHTAQSA
jgi:hypothetical protein